jgi:hypothetical protein
MLSMRGTLGCPRMLGLQDMELLKDRVWSKVKGWLSASGKEVLIKSVEQAITVYSMACFRLLQGLYELTNSLIRQIR